MSTIKIKQVKSRIGAPADQKRTLDALGLRKLNRVVEHESTPSGGVPCFFAAQTFANNVNTT